MASLLQKLRALLTGKQPAAPGTSTPETAPEGRRTAAKGRPGTDVILGLDFGTACTKVVIRTPYIAGRAVAFSSKTLGHESSPFLLPTVLHLGPDEVVVETRQAAKHLADLKARVLAQPNNLEACAAATAYLAQIIREARRWFERDQATSGYQPRWSLNLGIPSNGSGDSELRRAFARIASGAWQLSLNDGRIALPICRSFLEQETLPDPGIPMEIVPEIVSAAHGYAESQRHHDGLHMLVDVGASTLDVCSFVLWKPRTGERSWSLLHANVQPLGVHRLHRKRLAALRHSSPLSHLDLSDPFVIVPDDLAAYGNGDVPHELAIADTAFHEACVRQVTTCLLNLRKRRRGIRGQDHGCAP